MKLITLNSPGWIKAFIRAANALANVKPAYRNSEIPNNKTVSDEAGNSSVERKLITEPGDIMRIAHMGNFSSGPTFLFHPGWFK